jgi:hypothetical protein
MYCRFKRAKATQPPTPSWYPMRLLVSRKKMMVAEALFANVEIKVG